MTIHEIVESELHTIAYNEQGERVVPSRLLQRLRPETCIVLLLDAQSSRHSLADVEVYASLVKMYIHCIDQKMGGITRDTYRDLYSEQVIEAAKYHRTQFLQKGAT